MTLFARKPVEEPHQPASLKALAAHHRTLMLQGPMGSFFARLAAWLSGHGQQVFKVHFNGGDELLGSIASNNYRFTQPASEWKGWLVNFLSEHRIEAIVLFGQARPLHDVALKLARELGLKCYVFEEGYLRPDYVTLEEGGVNGHSNLPNDAEFYRALPRGPAPVTLPTRSSFWAAARWAGLYCIAVGLLWLRYRHFESHRCFNFFKQLGLWLFSGARKVKFAWLERDLVAELAARSKRWYLVPLQVHNDAQIIHHSRYDTVECFIKQVMASFAEHAARDHWLVLKHHPMDRAYRDYSRFIAEEAARLCIADRVKSIHDLHLPTLLRHTRGVVTVNSTAGLQAMHHNAPVIALGHAVYAIPGMVSTRPLAQFWGDPGKVDQGLYRRFRNYVIRHTQMNASFYTDTPALRYPVRNARPVAAPQAVLQLGEAE